MDFSRKKTIKNDTHPNKDANNGRHCQGCSVVAQPTEIEGNLDTKVIAD